MGCASSRATGTARRAGHTVTALRSVGTASGSKIDASRSLRDYPLIAEAGISFVHG